MNKHSLKRMRAYLDDPIIDSQIGQLVESAMLSDEPELYRELITNIIRLGQNQPHRADLKLFIRAFRDLRHANRVFSKYKHAKKITIFGSARTAPDRPEYAAAHDFAKAMAESGFMIITGAGNGIMGAAQDGAGCDRSFGLNIVLPFEQSPNTTINNDPKLVTFNYFFTRKLHFIKESHAIVCFPGGFGTMDESFEALTLMQTGRSNLVPIIFMDAPGGGFWKPFEDYLNRELLRRGLISHEDMHLFKITDSLEDAQNEIFNFYKNFHSYRLVKENLVIRMQRQIPESAVTDIEHDFADICTKDKVHVCHALPEEIDEPEISHLPRLRLPFNRRMLGRLRLLINRINEF